MEVSLVNPERIWKSIPFLSSRYEVSNTGIVRSLPFSREFTRKDGTTWRRNYNGYYLSRRIGRNTSRTRPSDDHVYVSIHRGSGRKGSWSQDFRVDTLVASAFHGVPYDRGNQREVQRWRVHHMDGDFHNCDADNLEWRARLGSQPGDMDSHSKNLAEFRASTENVMERLFGNVARGAQRPATMADQL